MCRDVVGSRWWGWFHPPSLPESKEEKTEIIQFSHLSHIFTKTKSQSDHHPDRSIKNPSQYQSDHNPKRNKLPCRYNQVSHYIKQGRALVLYAFYTVFLNPVLSLTPYFRFNLFCFLHWPIKSRTKRLSRAKEKLTCLHLYFLTPYFPWLRNQKRCTLLRHEYLVSDWSVGFGLRLRRLTPDYFFVLFTLVCLAPQLRC